MEEIKKLEDMPKYVPIVLIQNQDGTPRVFGNNPHDTLVVNYDKTNLYYYNSQCGDGSLFFKKNASCFDDDFYSSWVQMVNLEKLIADYTKQVRKEVCEEIYNKCEPLFRLVNNYDNGDVIERNELVDILDQLQGEDNGIR